MTRSETVRRLAAVYGMLAILSASGVLMVLLRIGMTREPAYLFFVWNLFLAWLPFFLSLLLLFIRNRMSGGAAKRILLCMAGLTWLAFYPNAPYMITDFIHLDALDFYGSAAPYSRRVLSDLLLWYDFTLFVLFVFTGWLLGFVSLFFVHRMLMAVYGRTTGWGFVMAVSMLSSYGIYLGRFLRWNSWDLLVQPLQLLREALESFNWTTIAFTAMFSLLLYLMYTALYVLIVRSPFLRMQENRK